jgi:hypothetical protein
MKRKLIATAVTATFLIPTLAAEEPPVVVVQHRHIAAAEAGRAQADAWKRWADDFSYDMRTSLGTMFGARMGPSKVVKGAPYSAEMVTETTQSLADGNTISHRKTGLVYRDGAGRTRQETGADGKSPSVFIDDPVEGKHLVLSPGTKSAVSVVLAAAPVAEHRITVNGKEVGHFGRGEVVVKKVQGPDGTERDEVRVHVVRPGDALGPLPPMPPIPPMPPGAVNMPMPPMPPIPGVHTMRFESTARLGKGVTTQLGTKDFDGVKAEGKSTVWTIPAGEIGNRDAIHVTSETWYSPELQVTVRSRYSDPRTGETVYRLANIRRGEPAPDLFKVPEDYQVKSRGRR